MFNCYKSISTILLETPSILEILKDADFYYAHYIPYSTKSPETLNQHVLLVQQKFELLISVHRLDEIVDLLINDLFKQNNLSFNQDAANFIKVLWVRIIVFHDYGKVNENFQASPIKMNNTLFKEITESPLSTKHSALGAYLYILRHFQELDQTEELEQYDNLISACLINFSYSIFKHHSKYLNDNIEKTVNFNIVEAEFMERYISLYNFYISKHNLDCIKSIKEKFYDNTDFSKCINSFALYSLLRLSFSLLTASDFLASGEYMTGLKIEEKDLGVLTRNRVQEMYEFISQAEWINKEEGKRNFNKSTYALSNTHYKFQNPTELSNTNLNLLRQEMGVEVLQNTRVNAHKNLFYIEAPTGGGKTNLSFLATIELLQLDQRLNKVFYVFPFTTLVTQTQKSLIESLGLSTDEVITLSSKSGFKEKNEQDKNELFNQEDDNYGNQKRFYLDNLFCFFPFCLLTHIKFFNILKTNEKEENYLLHRLSNSIVVLDELQAYNPKEWDKVMYFIKNYANFYNIKFIVMSATLPKLGDLAIKGLKKDDFAYLISNAKERYFKNPNFAKRVEFDSSLYDIKDLELEKIADALISSSALYAEKDFKNAKPRGSVYTIIEFIFKKSATNFYEIMAQKVSFFDEIFVLSGSILEHRRKYIINFLKNPENRKKKILLITTQVVEAGVDIDMDIGFKDTSLIDSDEQLAGRINRNVNKQDCVLYLFNYNRENIIYGKDPRYKITKDLSKTEYFEILKTKNFDIIYDKVIAERNNWNVGEHTIGLNEYENNIKQLRFQSAHFSFKLIDKEQEDLAVFIPMNIPVSVPGVVKGYEDNIFSKNEIDFLHKKNILPTPENKIDGREVFDLYLSMIGQKGDITEKKISDRIMQGIMSKFIIQILATKKIKLILFQDVEKSDKGYVYLEGWNNASNPFYHEEYGINDKAFDNIDTQFI